MDAHDGGLFGDEPLVQHVERHVQRGGAGALADAALQHPELSLLNGELDVEHVGEGFSKVVRMASSSL